MEIGSGQRVQTVLQRLTAARASNLDYLDALISSRSTHTAADVWTQATRNLTNPGAASDLANMQVAISPTATGRAALLDFLDAAITTRSSHTAADIWTQATRTLTNPASASDLANMLVAISGTATGRAALLDFLDAAITTRASAANYTPTRAGYLDNLSAGAVALAATALSTATWTATRAGYLDNLSGGAVALAANYTATRAAYLDNLIGTQTTGTYNHLTGTTEDDALVITPAELGKYEKLAFDLNTLTQTTTIRTYVQVDGTNYRLVDSAAFPGDFPTNSKSVVIDITPTSRTMRVTFQSAVAEGATRACPYFYVVRSLA